MIEAELITRLTSILDQPLPVELEVVLASGASKLRFEFSNRMWTFQSLEGLIEEVAINSCRKPYIQQLACYARISRDHLESDTLPSETGGAFPIARLQSALAIADSGGDVLFLDPETNFSVWVLQHDDMSVRKLAPSLKRWLFLARKQIPEAESPQVPRGMLKLSIEDALRDYVRHVLVPRGLLRREDFVTTIAGRDVLTKDEATIIDELAELNVRLNELDPQKDAQERDKIFQQIETLWRRAV